MKRVIGIDLGTSSVKTVLFDENLRVISSASEEYPLSQPSVGWAEQDPVLWWRAVEKTLSEVCSGIDKIDAVGISGQMHGLVMLDECGEVLRPAIIWCDQRTTEECRQITRLVGTERLSEITASPALTGFTASKLLWVRNNQPEIYKRCRRILLPKDYIRYRLTGVLAGDFSDASGTQLLDIRQRIWSDEILRALDIDRELLPKLYESPDVTGLVNVEGAASAGALCGAAVVAGAGDNASSAVGCGAVSEGGAFVTIGTSGVVYAHTDSPLADPLGRVHTFCSAVPGKWHVMGVTQGAGLSLKWLRDNFFKGLSYSELDAMAQNVAPGAQGLLFLPYLMGERTPHLDPFARGAFVGISAFHTPAHFIRAVLEGVAYSLRDCLEVLKEMNVPTEDIRAVGGGSKSGLWNGIISGAMGIPVKTVENRDCGALGAAILAAIGIGLYKDVASACEAAVVCKESVSPSVPEFYERHYGIYRSAYGDMKRLFHSLCEQ